LFFYKGGKGFYNAGDLSAKGVGDDEHKEAAMDTYIKALECVENSKFDLVICDEINNAVNDGLLSVELQKALIHKRSPKTSLCFTGRNFKDELINEVDIITNMSKIKHHFDDKYLANEGIDY
jgi:cob(I)alamin adenosyltransferase